MTSDLTPETIAHLRELDAARTQGGLQLRLACSGSSVSVVAGPEVVPIIKDADAEFIAAAANAMGALLDAAEERDKAKRAAKTLGEVVHQNCRMILDITGLHDWIDEDGDGDWGAVWENAYELLPRVKTAEAEVSRLRAELAEAQARIERVATLLGEWAAGGAASNPFPEGVVLDVVTEIIEPLRAALAPAMQREEGE